MFHFWDNMTIEVVTFHTKSELKANRCDVIVAWMQMFCFNTEVNMYHAHYDVTLQADSAPTISYETQSVALSREPLETKTKFPISTRYFNMLLHGIKDPC